jgi:DNA-binding transcriptional ArsR family regulator
MNKEMVSTPFDVHLDALGHVDRRRLLLALLHAESEGDLPVEVEQVERETGETTLQPSMYHVHLPKLDNMGFVDANLDRCSVTPGPRFDEIKPLLELLDENRERIPGGLP